MPQIKFDDTAHTRLSADKTTWFSYPTVKGLQLCVTAGGTKTWYVNRWDATADKTRRAELAQWARTAKHTAWAKKQVGEVAHDIDEGKAVMKAEAANARAGPRSVRRVPGASSVGARIGQGSHARNDRTRLLPLVRQAPDV